MREIKTGKVEDYDLVMVNNVEFIPKEKTDI